MNWRHKDSEGVRKLSSDLDTRRSGRIERQTFQLFKDGNDGAKDARNLGVLVNENKRIRHVAIA